MFQLESHSLKYHGWDSRTAIETETYMCFRLMIAVLCGGFAICYRHPHLKVWTCVDYGMAVRGSRAFVWFGRLFDRKVFGIPTTPRSMGFSWFCRYRFNGVHTPLFMMSIRVYPNKRKSRQQFGGLPGST